MQSEKLHIIPHNHVIDKGDRNTQKQHASFVIWLVGLSGSGKSTLANLLEQELYKRNVNTYILDGDNVRSGLNKDLTFNDTDRKENIRRIGEVAKLMVDAGIVVITAFITPFETERNTLKSLFSEGDYYEIYIDCPVEECEKRDVKGLYRKARAGEISHFTGISSPFEIPTSPDISIPTYKQSIEESLDQILQSILPKLKTIK